MDAARLKREFTVSEKPEPEIRGGNRPADFIPLVEGKDWEYKPVTVPEDTAEFISGKGRVLGEAYVTLDENGNEIGIVISAKGNRVPSEETHSLEDSGEYGDSEIENSE